MKSLRAFEERKMSLSSESLEIPKELMLLQCAFPVLEAELQSSDLYLTTNCVISRNVTCLKKWVIKVVYEMRPQLISF